MASIVDSVRSSASWPDSFRRCASRTNIAISADRAAAEPDAVSLPRVFSPPTARCSALRTARPTGWRRAHPSWLADLLTTPDLAVGHLVIDPAQKHRFLPIAVAIWPAPAAQPQVLVAALDTDWLAKHLEAARVDHPASIARAALIIADRDGNVVGRVPDAASWLRASRCRTGSAR